MSADILILPVVLAERTRGADLEVRAIEAWCLWNNCQGIFVDTVRWRRSDVEELLNQGAGGQGAEIIPVHVSADPDGIMRDIYETHEYGRKK